MRRERLLGCALRFRPTYANANVGHPSLPFGVFWVEVCALSALCTLWVEVCALSALCALWVEVCALSALCAIRAVFAGGRAGFGVLWLGPEGCGPSSPGGGSPSDQAESQQLLESEVD